MRVIDINCDMGEEKSNDSLIIKNISSANIACGYHAGSRETMKRTIYLAQENNVFIGAHPGYPDKENFGRTNMDMNYEEVCNIVLEQIDILNRIAKSEGAKITHVKLHGALYNRAAVDYQLSCDIINSVADYDKDLMFIVLADSQTQKACEEMGVNYLNEVFSDRAYDDDGHLVSRNIKGAVIHDEDTVIKRVTNMVENSKVISINGKEIDIKCDTICVHGDTKGSIMLTKKIKDKLIHSGYRLRNQYEI